MGPKKETNAKQGIFLWKDKSRYDGEYLEKDGVIYRHGYGIFTTDTYKYIGQWDTDKMHGQGKIEYKTGSIYDGNWVDGKYSGQGSFQFDDTSILSGLWVDGCINGATEYVDERAQKWRGDLQKGQVATMSSVVE